MYQGNVILRRAAGDDLRELNWRRQVVELAEAELKSRPGGVRVLEAGGGSSTFLRLERPVSYTTVDISQAQLDRNTYSVEKIKADIQEHEFNGASYDVVVFCDVLEHIEYPEKALRNTLEALEDRGLIVIKGPLRTSLKGLVTRLTPHWFHVLVYRHLLKAKNAGKPGYAPFPTRLKHGCDLAAVASQLEEHGCTIRMCIRFESNQMILIRKKFGAVYALMEAVSYGLRALSADRYGSLSSDFVIVACKSARKGRGPVRDRPV